MAARGLTKHLGLAPDRATIEAVLRLLADLIAQPSLTTRAVV